MPRRYPGCPGSVGGDDLGENGGVWRMGYNGPVSRIGLSSEKAPCEPHIPIATVLAQFVAFYQTRAFWISPWHALRAPLLGCTYRRPGNGCLI